MHTQTTPPARLAGPGTALLILFVLSPPAVFAATKIGVTSTAQEATILNPNGVSNSNCTLGEAVLAANGAASVDGCIVGTGGPPFVIVLPASRTFTFTQPQNWWYGPNALPAISSTIVIEGQGAVLQVADDQGITRLRFFYVGADPAAAGTLNFNTPGAGNLTLRQLTLTGGRQHGGDTGGNPIDPLNRAYNGGGGLGAGGAIFNQGALTLDRVTLTGNRAVGGTAKDGQTFGSGGGGIGEDAPPSGRGGGFGGPVTPAGSSGGDALVGGGGGGGFRVGQDGGSATALDGGAGGGARDGLGGLGGQTTLGPCPPGQCVGSPGRSGFGSGGGGAGWKDGPPQPPAGNGGNFGRGGRPGDFSNNHQSFNSGGSGGGGVGGGGGFDGGEAGSGGGGFGGGGGGNRANFALGGQGGFGAGGGVEGGGGFGGASGKNGGGGGAGMGGAIFNHGGTVLIVNSTFTDNRARGGIGNVVFGDGTGHNNDGDSLGGAIFNLNGLVSVSFTTFAGNLVRHQADALPEVRSTGGAIYNLGYSRHSSAPSSPAVVNLIDCILAHSTDGTNPVADLVNDQPLTVSDGGTNLASAFANLNGANIVEQIVVLGGQETGVVPLTVDPLLGPLANNGGPTETMAITNASPAFNSGVCLGGVTTDQRGVARPQPVGGNCDIGAFELAVGAPFNLRQ